MRTVESSQTSDALMWDAKPGFCLNDRSKNLTNICSYRTKCLQTVVLGLTACCQTARQFLHLTKQDAPPPADCLSLQQHRTDGNPAESLTQYLPFTSQHRS